MHRSFRHSLSPVVFCALFLSLSCQAGEPPAAENSAAEGIMTGTMEGMETSQEHGLEHSDHDPQYGGIFFMALDEVHHLEGTLTSPGMFQVYLYDALTMPLNSEEVKETTGTLHWGEFPDPPGIPLKVGNEEGTLMAELDREIEFPVTLTLLLNFPGAQDGESELFNFIFDEYSQPPAEEGGMSHEGMGNQ